MKFEMFGGKKKQEGIVKDEEKAHKMAEVEDEYREIAIALRRYMKDPIGYRKRQNELVENSKQEGYFSHSNADDYMELYNAGVRPEDLEALGERMAEYHAREYDFEKEIRNENNFYLRAVIAWLKFEQRLYARTYNKAVAQAEYEPVEERNYFVTHLLHQLGAGDEGSAIAEKIDQWIEQSGRMQKLAEAELQQRKTAGADTAPA